MLYLLRFNESGREAQPQRQRLRADLRAVLAERLPGAVVSEDVGRMRVETSGDASAVLADLHGLRSFSPCLFCPLAELERRLVDFAEAALAGHKTFAVRVKRVGSHDFRSGEMAARLGRAVRQRLPDSRVDLVAPDLVLGVEIRGDDCYLFDRTLPGLDHRPASPPAWPEPRFLADQMLGRLAAWLRLLGFDTVLIRHQADSVLLRRARAEQRVLLTQDRDLAAAQGAFVYLVRGRHAGEQLAEVVARFGLEVSRARLFSRCSLCNETVEPVAKEDVAHDVPPVAYRLFDEFTRCPGCGKVYWPGGHHDRILARLRPLLSDHPS